MRLSRLARRPTRRGISLAVLAVVTPVIIGFMGLCIDLGVSAVARAQLKTVADAAALAGANMLNDPQRIAPTFNLTADIGLAHSQAQRIGQLNSVLAQAAVVNLNSANSTSGDVVVGYKDVTVKNSPLVTDPTVQSTFNSVQVRAVRDSSHSGPVPSFFSRAMGFSDNAMTLTSTATAQNYAIKGFNSTKGSPTIWPITLSLTTYNAMLAGQTADNYTYSPSGSTPILSGPDGVFESTIYPVGSGAGNWGTVKVGVSNNSTSTLGDQIQYGVTAAEVAAAGGLILNPTFTLPGNPGVSLGIKPNILARIGDVVTIPIYDPATSGGNGNNFTYTIVKLVPVVVLSATFNGVHSNILIQPALTTDPTAIPGAPQSWTTGGVVRVRLSQ